MRRLHTIAPIVACLLLLAAPASTSAQSPPPGRSDDTTVAWESDGTSGPDTPGLVQAFNAPGKARGRVVVDWTGHLIDASLFFDARFPRVVCQEDRLTLESKRLIPPPTGIDPENFWADNGLRLFLEYMQTDYFAGDPTLCGQVPPTIASMGSRAFALFLTDDEDLAICVRGPRTACLANPLVVLKLQPDPAAIKRAARAHINVFLTQNLTSCWYPAVHLGDPARFARAIDEVDFVLDPTQTSNQAVWHPGRFRFSSNYVTLRFDARLVPPAELTLFRTTLWHELVHQMEDTGGDNDDPRIKGKPTGSPELERHTEWMEDRYNLLTNQVERFERLWMDEGADPVTLGQRWSNIRAQFLQGSNNQFEPIPTTLDKLEAWTGFRVDLLELEGLYRSGACGDVTGRYAGLFD